MRMRTIVGGIAGGIAMFLWGAVSHMVLGIQESAIKEFPNEPQVTAALQANLKEAGFYFFPGMGDVKSMSKEQRAAAEKAWTEKYLAGPRGVLVYRPDGCQAMSVRQLVLQLVAVTLAGLIAAIALAQAPGLKTYGCRLSFVAMLAGLPFLMVNFPYWNWYGFPTQFTLMELVEKVITFLAGGLVIAAIVKPELPAPAPATA